MDVTPLPADADLGTYRRLADDRVRTTTPGDERAPTLTLEDARHAIAREHGFADWSAFCNHVDALAVPDSPTAVFETAADAIVDGALTRLDALLAGHPDLVHARSGRIHHATLLHYVAANGVENYRQRTPPEIGTITARLLAAGADANAVADMYGGGATTLGLVASSVHPARARVQADVIAILIDAGADIEGAAGGWSPLMAALAHGHAAAVDTLVERGARLDNVAAAAGAGRLDRLETLLEAAAGGEDLALALTWASQFGRDAVVAWLLDRGHDVAALDRSGQSALHLAVHAGRLSTIDLLVTRGAPLERRNVHGGTALGQAVWSALNDGPGDYPAVIRRLLDAGADATAVHLPTGVAAIDALLARRRAGG